MPMVTACPPRRNGNMPAGPILPPSTVLAIALTQAMQTTVVMKMGQHRLVITAQTTGGFMICMEMSGNGVGIGGMAHTAAVRKTIHEDLLRARTACLAAGAGTAARCACGQLIATTAARTTITSAWASALFVPSESARTPLRTQTKLPSGGSARQLKAELEAGERFSCYAGLDLVSRGIPYCHSRECGNPEGRQGGLDSGASPE